MSKVLKQLRILTLGSFLTLIFGLLPLSASATSIQQLDFTELVSRAEMVFEGRVVSSNSRWNTVKTEIVTEIQFDVVDVIKGDFTASTLTLEFLGGQVGEQSMVVQSMVYPKLGEQGVYFVESLTMKQVNPLLGWSQGHFLVDSQGVLTNKGAPVLAIDSNEKASLGKFSDGSASGVIASKKITNAVKVQSAKTALSVQAFKNTIQQLNERAIIE